VTRYDYDGRDHRTWTYDPRFFGRGIFPFLLVKRQTGRMD